MLEAKVQGHVHKCSPKKRSLKTFFRRTPEKGVQKSFSGDQQNFNISKNSAVFDPKTGQFLRT